MNIGAVSQIENLEVQVRADKDFSVDIAGEEVNAIDILLLPFALPPAGPPGLAGIVASDALAAAADAASQAIKRHEDDQRATKLRAAIAEINPQSLSQKALVDALQSSLRFKSVTAATEREEPSLSGAGILRVRIEKWGLYASKSEERSLQKVQVGIHATATLVGGDGEVAWQKSDFFTGGVHRPIGEYGSSPDLLKSEIDETVRRYSASVANEIRYAK
jgi:hypothetical protein